MLTQLPVDNIILLTLLVGHIRTQHASPRTLRTLLSFSIDCIPLIRRSGAVGNTPKDESLRAGHAPMRAG